MFIMIQDSVSNFNVYTNLVTLSNSVSPEEGLTFLFSEGPSVRRLLIPRSYSNQQNFKGQLRKNFRRVSFGLITEVQNSEIM